MNQKEIDLNGGQSTAVVVQIGDTVRRSIGEHSKFVHILLQYLEQQDFKYSPRFLGIDEQGREILSFIVGEVPRGIQLTEEQLICCIKILREFHDVAAKSNLCNGEETICHNDFSPWNIILNNNIPVGIIDFDEAVAGSRIDDVAYFLWTFLELGNSQFSDETQIRRIALLCNAYQLENKKDLIDAILKQQKRILEFRKDSAANEADKNLRQFSADAVQRIMVEIQWIKSNRKKIVNRLLG